jgi:hypothetical protein
MNEMDSILKINQPDSMKENGYTWYSPEYVRLMMQRSYDKGKNDGLREPVKHEAIIKNEKI